MDLFNTCHRIQRKCSMGCQTMTGLGKGICIYPQSGDLTITSIIYTSVCFFFSIFHYKNLRNGVQSDLCKDGTEDRQLHERREKNIFYLPLDFEKSAEVNLHNQQKKISTNIIVPNY